MRETDPTEAFIARWADARGSERANYQLFITELCALLGVPTPEPANDEAGDNAYVFERRVTFAHGDGQPSFGFIDCYRRGAFVLEAKKVKVGAHTKGFDEALLRARGRWRDRLPTILATLEALGRAQRVAGAAARWQAR